MNEITLIFPDQLFEHHPGLESSRPVVLAEEFLFFKIQPFHKQRLVLLRAAMKFYADFLSQKGFKVYYIESSDLKKRGDLFVWLAKKFVRKIHLAEFTDDWLKRDLEESSKKFDFEVKFYNSPLFLCQEKELILFFKGKNHFSMTQFYAYQRKKLGILMENGGPVGGKYSFDSENRKKLPKGIEIPFRKLPKKNPFVEAAVIYVEKEFPEAIGKASPFLYPVTFLDAKESLEDFISHRLSLFGDYEDAITQRDSFLFHSVLSPLLNIGLLTPNQVIERILIACRTSSIPLNSLEGFIRQVIGWREFVRACYLFKGRKQRLTNFFEHQNSIPKSFWEGRTGILPIDKTIERIFETGYCHHIERLMVLGNFLLLIEVDPNEVYDWFMGNFVDAYDWVMVPNVYGMSQYADGGGMTTKPYVSGSNYILKMSDYPKGAWTEIWDGLFWRFLGKHHKLFGENPRTKVLLQLLAKNQDSIRPKILLADQWISKNCTINQ